MGCQYCGNAEYLSNLPGFDAEDHCLKCGKKFHKTETADEFLAEWDEKKRRVLESYCIAVRFGAEWTYLPLAYNYTNSQDQGVLRFTKEDAEFIAAQLSRQLPDCTIKIENKGSVVSFWENHIRIWSSND